MATEETPELGSDLAAAVINPISDDNTLGDLQTTVNLLLEELQKTQAVITQMLPLIDLVDSLREDTDTTLPLISKVDTLETEIQDRLSMANGGTISNDLRITGNLYLAEDPIKE